MNEVKLTLPVPPTINHYYGVNKHSGGRYLKKRAKVYRHEVALLVHAAGFRGAFGKDKLVMRIDLYLPAGGDLDNRLKSLLDALEYAELFENDSQIDDLRVVRGHKVKGGRCDVLIWRI